MRSVFCCLYLLLFASVASATHFLGGYIRVTPVSGLTYRVTVTAYYDVFSGTSSAQTASDIAVCFGEDQAVLRVQRTSIKVWPENQRVSLNEYTAIHTYTGPGIYTIQASGPNRTVARNTGDSPQPFTLRTTVQVGQLQRSQTPQMSLPAGGV